MNPFETMGLEPRFDIDTDLLERRYRDLQRALHPDRHVHAPATERRMSLVKAMEVNEACRVLRDDILRAQALLDLRGAAVSDNSEEPGFLMEMMELREALSDGRAAQDGASIAALGAKVRAELDGARAELSGLLDGPESTDQATLGAATRLLGRLRYYQRFADEVSATEEDLEEARLAGAASGAGG